MSLNILFVCTGNTCRSPMAEAILKNKKLQNISVKSAGIFAVDGHNASQQAMVVLEENNIEHSHTSKMLTEEDIQWATLILTMTESHKSSIIESYPFAKEKTFTLKEFVNGKGDNIDVGDPFGGSVEMYRTTFLELSDLIEKAIEKIK
ncbi:low molecular weight phosphatase family protein [Heyndrickxia sporothermodurans]|nr:low molecular weight protein arginine phosphatase [Heyndrickxia sporothermodurans]PTY78230.1 low molecular weight phosphatase family protein [Heyndrickxia sporothermodurans]